MRVPVGGTRPAPWTAPIGSEPGYYLSASLGGSRPPSAHRSAPQAAVPAAGLSVAPPAGWGRAAPSRWAGDAQQFGTATATRHGGGPGGPLGLRRAAGSGHPGPPRFAHHVCSDCPEGRNPQLEPVKMKMSPGLLDCLVFSGRQFIHPKLSTGEPNDS